MLHELGRIESFNPQQKFRFVSATVNIENKNIFLCAKNDKKTDKEYQTQVYLFREKAVED